MGQPYPGHFDPGKRRTEEDPGDLLLVFTRHTDLHAAGLWQEQTGEPHATAVEGIKDAR